MCEIVGFPSSDFNKEAFTTYKCIPHIKDVYTYVGYNTQFILHSVLVGNHHKLSCVSRELTSFTFWQPVPSAQRFYRRNNTVCRRNKLFGTFLYTDGLAYGSNEYHICFLDGPCYRVHPTKYAHRCVVLCFVGLHNDSRALLFRLAKPASGQRMNK